MLSYFIFSIISIIGDVPADIISDFKIDVENAQQKIYDWQCHILRTVNQDMSRTSLLESLTTHQCLIVMDWAMKFLPMSFREKQSDWYAQKGINWHVSVCIYKTNDQQLKVSNSFSNCFTITDGLWYTYLDCM